MKSQPSKINYKTGLKIVREMNVAGGPGGMFGYGGAGGDIGSYGGSVGNQDFYGTGDARIPHSIFGGKILTRAGATGGSGKTKAKRKKKKRKTKSYQEAFREQVSSPINDKDFNLACMIYSENPKYQTLVTDILEKHRVFYNSNQNAIIIEGTDDRLQSVLSVIESVITTEPFENGEVIAFIGEMDMSLQKPEKGNH